MAGSRTEAGRGGGDSRGRFHRARFLLCGLVGILVEKTHFLVHESDVSASLGQSKNHKKPCAEILLELPSKLLWDGEYPSREHQTLCYTSGVSLPLPLVINEFAWLPLQ